MKDDVLNSNTPEESIDQAYKQIISSLTDEILTEVIKEDKLVFDNILITLQKGN